ncbi:LPXTG cell wall anchor domain-containing protein [Ligilactobacillus saerimneri]|uniref:LPXTG cell wall anchor domain-containing protein n=1 Tax=Ligilactobacillus saerimneri TaxID=228229 RepID=UPI003F29381A
MILRTMHKFSSNLAIPSRVQTILRKKTSVVPSQTTVNTAKLVKINSNLPQTGEEASAKVSLLGAILAAIGLSGLGITWKKSVLRSNHS